MNTWGWVVLILVVIVLVVLFCIPKPRSGFIITKGKGSKKSLSKTKKGTYIKKWSKENDFRYFREKKFYTRLKNNNHFPDLISYDDEKLELEVEDAGPPLIDFSKRQLKKLEKQIPNWKQQIKEIIIALNENDLTYNDWHAGNILYKDKLLKVIDFDTTRALLVPQKPLDIHTSLESYLRYIHSLKYKKCCLSPSRK